MKSYQNWINFDAPSTTKELSLAALRGEEEMVQVLLMSGADPNAADCLGVTALYQAANSKPGHSGTLRDTPGICVIFFALTFHVCQKHLNLVGGDWNMTCIFPYIGNSHPN